MLSSGGQSDGVLLCCRAGVLGGMEGTGAQWHVSVFFTIHTEGAAGQHPGLRGYLCLAPQGEFRVAERKITMKEFLRALEDGRVQEVFGSGTACQVCPVHQILYQGKVRRGRPGPSGRRRWWGPVLTTLSSPAFPHSHHGKRAPAYPPLLQGTEGDPGEVHQLGPGLDARLPKRSSRRTSL